MRATRGRRLLSMGGEGGVGWIKKKTWYNIPASTFLFSFLSTFPPLFPLSSLPLTFSFFASSRPCRILADMACHFLSEVEKTFKGFKTLLSCVLARRSARVPPDLRWCCVSKERKTERDTTWVLNTENKDWGTSSDNAPTNKICRRAPPAWLYSFEILFLTEHLKILFFMSRVLIEQYKRRSRIRGELVEFRTLKESSNVRLGTKLRN